MSNLLSQIRGEIRQAMLEKNDVKKNILRVVVGEVERKTDSDDASVLKTIKKIIEGNNESLGHAANPVLLRENEILSSYLPKALSVAEIEAALIADPRIKDAKSEGQAIGIAMKSLKNADGNDVKEVVRKLRM